MAMRCRWERARLGEEPRGEAAGGDLAGRLLTGLLALYLTPALLVVLLVGGAGLLILAVAQLGRGAEPRPHGTLGPGPSAR
jgi:hypothetical protein